MYTFDHQFIECANGASNCGVAVFAPHNQLANQVVVVLAYGVAGFVSAIETRSETVWCCQLGNRSR